VEVFWAPTLATKAVTFHRSAVGPFYPSLAVFGEYPATVIELSLETGLRLGVMLKTMLA
jgi:hypothetical protein